MHRSIIFHPQRDPRWRHLSPWWHFYLSSSFSLPGSTSSIHLLLTIYWKHVNLKDSIHSSWAAKRANYSRTWIHFISKLVNNVARPTRIPKTLPQGMVRPFSCTTPQLKKWIISSRMTCPTWTRNHRLQLSNNRENQTKCATWWDSCKSHVRSYGLTRSRQYLSLLVPTSNHYEKWLRKKSTWEDGSEMMSRACWRLCWCERTNNRLGRAHYDRKEDTDILIQDMKFFCNYYVLYIYYQNLWSHCRGLHQNEVPVALTVKPSNKLATSYFTAIDDAPEDLVSLIHSAQSRTHGWYLATR